MHRSCIWTSALPAIHLSAFIMHIFNKSCVISTDTNLRVFGAAHFCAARLAMAWHTHMHKPE